MHIISKRRRTYLIITTQKVENQITKTNRTQNRCSIGNSGAVDVVVLCCGYTPSCSVVGHTFFKVSFTVEAVLFKTSLYAARGFLRVFARPQLQTYDIEH